MAAIATARDDNRARQSRSPAELRDMFGANLRHLAQQYPSISELSRRLGINRTQFNRYMSGESFPRPDVLDRICCFFDVDARILLEPVDTVGKQDKILHGAFLNDFLGHGIEQLSEQIFPSGYYRFTRRSFINGDSFVVGLVRISRDGGGVAYIKGFEAKDAMRFQGLPEDPASREFRGVLSCHEDGVAFLISRRRAMTFSFNYLARVASLENNFWVGYVARTVRESGDERVTRMVYEYLGRDMGPALAVARNAGFVSEEDLLPYHRRLLRINEPFS